MSETPLHHRSIAELGRNFRDGGLSPVALTEHFLARLDRLEPRLKAFKLVCAERALAQAQAAESQLRAGIDLGPLHGIPYAAKDLYDVAGLPTMAGTRLLEDNIAERDCSTIARLTRAGMVLLGKTHTVQFAYGGAGVNHDHGTPHNPWSEIHCVPGGSSSGSGVAVAAGMAPMALGTDTGGSVRIPAALNGVTGLKTTVGRIGRGGVYPLSASLDSVGPLARTVEDAALIYTALQGEEPDDETTHGVKPVAVLGSLARGVTGLRLAIAEHTFFEDVDSEVEAAVRQAGRVLEGLGAKVERIPFTEAGEAAALNPRGLVIAAEAYAVNRRFVDNHFDQLDPVVAHRIVQGRDITAADYLNIVQAWRELRARMAVTFADVDALLVPTTMIPAKPLAQVDQDIESYSHHNVQYLRNTAIGNILGLCGLSVPCGFSSDGMPIGLMIYGKPFDEAMVLRVGHAYQQATGWHRKTPSLAWAGE